ncbi:hypothetical protein NFI96_003139 [Prochilodus magdalenae]|nr:hypothetical protein NFI96_003139 [Prochilodus magdalenae]
MMSQGKGLEFQTCLIKPSRPTDTQKLDSMPRSREIQEDMREKVTEICQSGEGSKASSKVWGLQRTTARAVIHKRRKRGAVVNLPRSSRPTKITPRAQQRLIQEVTKDPTTTSKDPQGSPASVKLLTGTGRVNTMVGSNELSEAFRETPEQRVSLEREFQSAVPLSGTERTRGGHSNDR